MSIHVTAERNPPNYRTEYVLKDGERIIARLDPHTTVESAYQYWKKESKKEFDFRSAGYARVNWNPFEDNWDQYLADQRHERHRKQQQRAQDMLSLLEPHRNAPLSVEALWQQELRREQEAWEKNKNKKTQNIEKTKRTKRQNVAQAVQRTPKPDPFAELGNLVGLPSVKDEVRLLVNYLKVQKAREAAGLATSEQKVHMVFLRNTREPEKPQSRDCYQKSIVTWACLRRATSSKLIVRDLSRDTLGRLR